MARVFLISEDYIKSMSSLDDNVSGKYLQTAIKLAQDTQLQSTIGTPLLEAICEKVADNTIKAEGNIWYKRLLDDFILPYLLYLVLGEVVVPTTYKLGNFGVVKAEDEKLVETNKVEYLRKYYLDKSDYYKERLQRFLCQYSTEYRELWNVELKDMFPNLYSSSSSALWLGGFRGKPTLFEFDYRDLPNYVKKEGN